MQQPRAPPCPLWAGGRALAGAGWPETAAGWGQGVSVAPGARAAGGD